MDMILGPFCDQQAAELDLDQLSLFEVLLDENDHDLYLWVSGQAPPPSQYSGLIKTIRAHAEAT